MTLLVITLIVLLSKPFFNSDLNKKTNKWIVVDLAVLKSTEFNKIKPTIDSLKEAGFELRSLNKYFPFLSTSDSESDYIDYWAAIPEIEKAAGAGCKLYFVGYSANQHFSSSRPSATLDINWLLVPYTSAQENLSNVYLKNDSLFVKMAFSDAAGKWFKEYRFEYLKTPFTIKHKDFELKITGVGSRIFAALRDQKILVKQYKKVAIVYDKDRKEDLVYFEAAIRAINKFTPLELSPTAIQEEDTISKKADFVIWLSKQEIENIDSGAIILKDSWADFFENSKSEVFLNASSIKLNRVDTLKSQGISIFKNSVGKSILDQQVLDYTVFTFHSRFNPEYSDLVISDQFPQFLYSLFNGNLTEMESENFDLRKFTSSQAQTIYVEGIVNSDGEAISLSWVLGIMALLLFCTERWLSL